MSLELYMIKKESFPKLHFVCLFYIEHEAFYLFDLHVQTQIVNAKIWAATIQIGMTLANSIHCQKYKNHVITYDLSI